MSVFNPMVIFEIGFQLSFISLLGMVYISPILRKFLKIDDSGAGFLNWKMSAIETFSAQLVVAPLLIKNFNEVSITSLLANVFILEFVPITMFLGFLLAFVSLLSYYAGFLISWLTYRNYIFMLEEYDLKIRKGILSKQEISIPYRQIQDVSVNRSITYRLLGLSRLVLTTAGQEEPGVPDETDGVLDPLDRNLAEQVRQELERRIGVQLVENEFKNQANPAR